MSMIGYILGLGDRHLDNVLVDLNQGQVRLIFLVFKVKFSPRLFISTTTSRLRKAEIFASLKEFLVD